MNILLPYLRLQLDTVANLKCTRLVVCAVWARNKLLVLSLVWEPSLEIILLCCSIVQCPGDNLDNPIRNTKWLIELLWDADHVVKSFPWLLRIRDKKLFNLYTCIRDTRSASGTWRLTFSNWCTRKSPQASFPCDPASLRKHVLTPAYLQDFC